MEYAVLRNSYLRSLGLSSKLPQSMRKVLHQNRPESCKELILFDTQYLTKSLGFLSGYLSFDDVVVASILFLFGLVLSSEQYSLLEFLGLGFRTEFISLLHNGLEFLGEEGLLS